MSERKKAYRAKRPRGAGAAEAEEFSAADAEAFSDVVIATMVKTMESIHAVAQKALAAYWLSLEYAEDDNVQTAKLHLFDRAARRVVRARRVFESAVRRQPRDFARIITESMK